MSSARVNCPICTGDSLRLSRKDGRWIRLCLACRHAFWEQMPTQVELAGFYAASYSEAHGQLQRQQDNRRYYQVHARTLARARGRHIPGTRLLDFGSSYPILVQEAIAAGMQAIGVDDSAQVHQWSAANGIRCLKPSQLGEIPDQSIDILRLSHVLEHLVDPKSTLTVLLEKVKVGGLVYISQPNFPVFLAQAADIHLKDSVWPTHLHFFSVASLVRLAGMSGLAVFGFDTHPLPSPAEQERLMAAVDPDGARLLACLKGVRTRSFGRSGFPWYLGENSECWARKKPPDRPSDTEADADDSKRIFGRTGRLATKLGNLKSRVAWLMRGRPV